MRLEDFICLSKAVIVESSDNDYIESTNRSDFKRKQINWYCNCKEDRSDTRHIDNIATFNRVEVDANDCCLKCGYYAVASEEDPRNPNKRKRVHQ